MARMLGKSSQRPYVYGAGTGKTKKCFGCWDGCGYDADNGTQRQREKRAAAHEAENEIGRYELDRLESALRFPVTYDGQCRRDGLQCTCNGDRCL